MSNDSLHQLLLADIGHAEQLLALIDAEYQALQARDLQSLEKLLTQKLPLLSLLDQHGKQRSRILIEANLSPDADGLKHYASQSADGEQLLQRSEQLTELIGQCQRANAGQQADAKGLVSRCRLDACGDALERQRHHHRTYPEGIAVELRTQALALRIE